MMNSTPPPTAVHIDLERHVAFLPNVVWGHGGIAHEGDRC